jgi:hypothetical protein
MPRIASKVGAEPYGPCVWVAQLDNPEYEALLEKYAYEIKHGIHITDPAYEAMFQEFLIATNQEMVDD